MTATELAKLVSDMRAAQREYFRTRTRRALEQAKAMEAAVDEAVAEVLSAQMKLFGG